MPRCLPRDDTKKVYKNKAVIAGDTEKRETKPLRRCVPTSSQDTSGLLCRLGKFFHFQAGLFTKDDRLLADWMFSQQLKQTILYHFPLKQITKCSFPPWKGRQANILCALRQRVHEIASGKQFFSHIKITLERVSMGHIQACRGTRTWIKSTASSITGSQSAG